MKRFVLAGALSLLLAVWFTTTGSMADTTDLTTREFLQLDQLAAPGPKQTMLAASVLTDPTPVRGTDGRLHIAYELVLTNTVSRKIGIDQIDVLDSDTQGVLLSLAGSMLSANMNRLRLGEPPVSPPYPGDTTIAATAVSIVWLDVQLDDNADIPQHLEHRIVGSFLEGQLSPFDNIVARIETNETAPPRLVRLLARASGSPLRAAAALSLITAAVRLR